MRSNHSVEKPIDLEVAESVDEALVMPVDFWEGTFLVTTIHYLPPEGAKK